MKVSVICLAVILSVFMLASHSVAQSTFSGQAAQESAKAGSHGSKAVVNSIAASGQATSAVSAVPLAASGAAGAVSGQVAGDLLNAASQPAGKPLEITDETVTAGPPPDQALKVKNQQKAD